MSVLYTILCCNEYLASGSMPGGTYSDILGFDRSFHQSGHKDTFLFPTLKKFKGAYFFQLVCLSVLPSVRAHDFSVR